MVESFEIEVEEIPNLSWGFGEDEPRILGDKPKLNPDNTITDFNVKYK